ncbi:hypothetical protein Ahy_B07g088465 [Arachis hypogaea]|uniref:Uncharacterized protein n=1 Tax=Arachis hypogaea TaxID=3818 RepID=A0A444YEI0_ARAHY|nr:hypothetical protein Ahy_B07g088465 [Arachis hypogaea]
MKAVVWSVEVVGIEGYGKLCVERKLPSSTEVEFNLWFIYLWTMQMDDMYVVPVFHHGGRFARKPSGTLEYIGGKVEKFPKMDLDFVNFRDLVTLFKGLGYASYRTVYWFDPTSSDLEGGLHILRGDAGINELRENKMKNSTTDEFYIYFDHPVDEPEIVDEATAAEAGVEEFDDPIDVDSIMRKLQPSPSTEAYGQESEEDEMYKPPPSDSETVSDEDCSSVDEDDDRMRKKRSVKGKEKVVPKTNSSVKEGTGAESSGVKNRGRVRSARGSAAKGDGPTVKTRGTAKPKETGPREKPKKTRPAPKPKRNGPNANQQRSRPAVDAEEPLPNVQPRDLPPIGLYVSEEISDDDDPIYEYASEELHTPVSSEDEGEKHEFPVFNEEYGFGEGRFEIGTKFATIDGFKEAVKDMFISEGRELLWIKNDKERVRVGCRGEECPWLAHLSYNKTLLCYQVKTYKAEHTCARDLGSNAADQHWDQSQTQTESLAENSAVQEKSTNHVISQNAAATTPSAPVQIPFKPPSQQPRMGQPKTPATSSKFRPKQTIRRPQASANPPSNPPATPPPDTTQTQSTSASVATSEETFKVAGSEAIGMNFIPTPGSKNQKN